jgi:hypothetical protein
VHHHGWVLRRGFKGPFGDVEYRLALPRPRQADDHLSGTHHLSGISADRGDDTVIVGFEFGVAEILAGLNLLGARRIELCRCGLEGFQRLIVLDPRRMAILQQFALPRFLRLAAGHLGVRCGDLGFRDFEVLPILLRIEPGDQITFLHFRTNIDWPLENFAVNPKADIGLVTWLDLSGKRQRVPRLAEFNGDRAHRSDGLRRSLLFFVAGRQNRHQNESSSRPQRKSQQASRAPRGKTCSTHHRQITR